MKSTSKLAVTALTGLLFCAGAGAYEAGDIIVRAGSATVAPDESSDGIAIPALDIAELAGTEAEVNSDTQMGITATYMLSSRWGVELLAATPFSHRITANLEAAGLGSPGAGETRHLPPTLSVVWYVLGSEGRVSPYIGAGINYTLFFEEDVDTALEAAAGSLAGLGGPLPMSLSLDDSVGLAVQVGIDVAVNDRWHLNGSVRWIDINTDATFRARDGSAIPEGTTIVTVDDVGIDPWVYQVNLGYRF